MHIFEIIIPGTWLDYEDRDWSFRIKNLLDHLLSQFFEANTALNLFEQSSATILAEFDQAAWEQDCQRRSEIRSEVESEFFNNNFNTENWEKISFETEVRFKREKWSKGIIPKKFNHAEPFIYARTFLYALDSFDKFLGVLSQEAGVPSELITIHKKFSTEFPDLRAVRNTAQHLEDRARGLGAGKKPKPMDIKPVDNNLISAPNGGVLILNSLNGSKYGSTMADGHFGEVDVSPDSMVHLQKILVEVLQTFRWRGSQVHVPD